MNKISDHDRRAIERLERQVSRLGTFYRDACKQADDMPSPDNMNEAARLSAELDEACAKLNAIKAYHAKKKQEEGQP